MLVGVLWVVGCIGYAIFNVPYYRLHFAIDWAKHPVLAVECADADASEYLDVETSDGKSVSVALCFVASKASNEKMLVPYAEDPSKAGWLLMHDKYSREVREYTKVAANSFRFPDSALKDAKAIKRAAYLDQWKNAMLFLFGGLATGWAIVAGLGWVIRGFMGIPRGKDTRPTD